MESFWQRLRLNRFIVLGRVGMDLYADPPGTKIEDATRYISAIGGSAGNIAVALARQGSQAALLTRVSADAVGRYCVAELDRYGVDTRLIRASGGETRTSLAVVETRPTDAQTVLYRNGAADFALTESDVAAIDFHETGALIVTGTALAREPSRGATQLAIRQARQAGAVVVLDLDYRAYSWASREEAARICLEAAEAAHVVVGNDDEFGLLAGSHDRGAGLAQDLAQHGALFTVYKRGQLGSVSFLPDREFQTGIFRVDALKPMGAGDGFMGGLMAGLAQGHDLETSVQRGAATAAIIVAGIGCAPASPDTATLDDFIQRP
ncbi:5-dehydro-2-deoxygluconokinase [Tabrizicola sp.]|uniref:5-dehydro-2-deoxygluconokinase n=1 Tax=Tabrizicola sp. TaxID=2005166 RepID=UPI003F39B30E